MEPAEKAVLSDPALFTIAFAAFLVVIAIMVFVRTRTKSAFEIKNSDIVLALIPVVFVLFVTGKIQKFAFGGMEIETAFADASNTEIADQVTSVESLKPEVVNVEMAEKAGVREIPRLIQEKTEALVFHLGHGGYWGPAIEEYLNELLKFSFLKTIVIQDQKGNLVGTIGARELASVMQTPHSGFSLEEFAGWLNRSESAKLGRLPGFVAADQALNENASKQEALQRMDEMNVEWLPVVNDKGQFVGLADRSRLAASLIIDVARRLE